MISTYSLLGVKINFNMYPSDCLNGRFRRVPAVTRSLMRSLGKRRFEEWFQVTGITRQPWSRIETLEWATDTLH